ncbi:MAG: RNA 2'-phosphotransferase [Candidatus Promineifilaceae bacterium]
MSKINFRRLSQTMSHALRHAPQEYNLMLDPAGWVAVDDLLVAIRKRRRWPQLEQSHIEAMMAAASKQRYELIDGRVRALYGHSVATKIEKTPTVPPEILYHGTTDGAAESIRREGLRSMRRQYVHLSADTKTATIVGKRRTQQPILLEIRALEAHQAGILFYRENNGIWLAEPIPAKFIDG